MCSSHSLGGLGTVQKHYGMNEKRSTWRAIKAVQCIQ